MSNKIFSFIIQWLPIPLVLVLLWYFLFSYRFAFNYETEINDHYLLAFAFPYIGGLVLANILTPLSVKKLCWLVFMMAISGYLFLSKYFAFGNEYFFVCAVIFLSGSGLLFIKNPTPIYTIIGFILVLYFFQMYTGIGQWWDIRASEPNIMALSIKGTLENSGVFACYLVVHFPMLYYFFYGIQNRLKTIKQAAWPLGILSFLLVVVPAVFLVIETKSRTAIVALLITALAAVFLLFGKLAMQTVKRMSKPWLIGIICLVGIGMVAGGYYLFLLKRMSAMGRLMKLRIASEHITDNFFTGTGIGRFSWYYPQWQVDYFKNTSRPPLDYFLSAGESYIIFNEFLQWFLTVGMLGSLSTILLGWYFFNAKSVTHNVLFRVLKLTVIAILACGLSAYPLHINYFLLLLAICFFTVCGLKDTGSFLPRLKGFGIGFSLAVCVVLGLASKKGIEAFFALRQWESKEIEYSSTFSEKPEGTIFEKLGDNGKLLTVYGAMLAEDSATISGSISILETALKFHFSRKTLEELARANKRAGNYSKAIFYFEKIGHFLPNKFLPQKEIMNTYFEMKDTARAKKVAAKILQMPVKIRSWEVDSVKVQANRMLY